MLDHIAKTWESCSISFSSLYHLDKKRYVFYFLDCVCSNYQPVWSACYPRCKWNKIYFTGYWIIDFHIICKMDQCDKRAGLNVWLNSR